MRIPFAAFPEVGVASLLAMDDAAVGGEVVSIGSEGMVGVALAHEVDHSPHRCIMQVAGRGKRIDVAALLRQLPDLPVLRRLLRRYADAMFNEAAQSILCTRRHSIDERCARWLLLTDDRVADPVEPREDPRAGPRRARGGVVRLLRAHPRGERPDPRVSRRRQICIQRCPGGPA